MDKKIDLTNGQFVPKVINRYMVELPESIGIPSYFISSCSMPNIFENGSIELRTWLPLIENNVRYTHAHSPENASQKFDIKYKFLNETGEIIGDFILRGCLIDEISNSNLDYNKYGQVSGKMTIKYDRCDSVNQFINVRIPLVGDYV